MPEQADAISAIRTPIIKKHPNAFTALRSPAAVEAAIQRKEHHKKTRARLLDESPELRSA